MIRNWMAGKWGNGAEVYDSFVCCALIVVLIIIVAGIEGGAINL